MTTSPATSGMARFQVPMELKRRSVSGSRVHGFTGSRFRVRVHETPGVIARDRGAGYRQATTDGRPEGVQVADRWHLMENASAAFLNAVRRSMHAIRKAVGVGIFFHAETQFNQPIHTTQMALVGA